MRTHEYTIGKGYPESLKGTVVTWPLPTTIREAIDNGFFKDEATLVHRACANLNVDKGHAIQDAVTEAVEEGKPIPTVAEMAKIAAETNATGEVRKRGSGGAKVAAASFNKIVENVSAKWASASAEERAALVRFGIFNEDGTPVRAEAPAVKPRAKKEGASENGAPSTEKGKGKAKAAK